MCSPTAAMLTMTGLQIAGGLSSYQANQQQGQDKQNYYNYLAKQNEDEANLTLKRGAQTVTSIQDVASYDEMLHQRSVKQVEGSQRAAEGASGTAGSVTAEDIARDTMKSSNLDEMALRYQADSKSWEAQTAAEDRATALRQQASSFRYAGAIEKRAGDINANASLLNSATSVASNWYDFSRTSMGRAPGTVKVRTRPSGGYATAPDYGNA